MQYAPIIIFAFNRLDTIKSCVEALRKNQESKDSDLYVYVDGARANVNGEEAKVARVREFAKTITGFKNITLKFSDSNKGLAKSIIFGTTEVIEKYGKVIVLEDDLVPAPGFLSFVNTMLDAYKDDQRIMQISGYSAKIRNYKKYNCEYYMGGRAHSWSWATWKDRWETVDWEVKDYDELASSKERQKSFCEFGSDLYGMLKGWHDGKNNSWYIRFNYSMHKQGKYCVVPIKSLIRNDGFGAEATHTSAYNRYKIDFDTEKRSWKVVDQLQWNPKLAKEAVRYWSIPYRIYGKIMTYLTKLWI